MIHNNNFNFLRLLLAILVLLSHSPELIDGNRHREILTNIFHTISFGELAVNGFFLLSGYLILQSWQRKPQFASFMKKRILRIYPGFIAASLVCIFLVGPLGKYPIDFFGHIDTIECLKNMFLLKEPVVNQVFQGYPYASVNSAMWTIVYEFRCYLLVAILGAAGALKQKIIWLLLSILVLVISIIPAATVTTYFPQLSHSVEHYLDIVRLLTFFCAGGSFYLFRERIHYSNNLIFAALFIVIISLFNSLLLKLVLPTLGAYVFLCFSFLELPILKIFKTSSDVSYGVYLYGWPTQKLLIWYIPSLSPWLLFILAGGISIVCGLLSWYLVEKPSLRLRN